MTGALTGLFAGSIIGGATLLGAAGIFVRSEGLPAKIKSLNLDFAFGMMLAAAAFNLIAPAYQESREMGWVSFSLLLGIVSILLFHKVAEWGSRSSQPSMADQRSVLFVVAMMLHNFPEGMAAGVSFQSQLLNPLQGLSVMTALVVQNIPEGLTTAFAFKCLGMKTRNAFLAAGLTALMEVLGGFVGGGFREFSAAALPMTLAFAGGAMIAVTVEEILEKVKKTNLQYLFNKNFVSGIVFILAMNALLN